MIRWYPSSETKRRAMLWRRLAAHVVSPSWSMVSLLYQSECAQACTRVSVMRGQSGIIFMRLLLNCSEDRILDFMNWSLARRGARDRLGQTLSQTRDADESRCESEGHHHSQASRTYTCSAHVRAFGNIGIPTKHERTACTMLMTVTHLIIPL